MSQHEYAYDIKMAAVIRVRADNKKQACRLARQAANSAYLEFPAADDQLKLAIVDASIEMDDVDGPYLVEIDGEDVDRHGNPF